MTRRIVCCQPLTLMTLTKGDIPTNNSQVRTLIQFSVALVFTLTLVLLLDRNYRVLPDSIHSHLPGHHPGQVVTDVTVVTCSKLSPFSNCDLDPNEWHRLHKELYLGLSWTAQGYVYVKRKHEEELTEDDKVVIDLTVGRLHPDEKDSSEDLWEARPLGLWLKRSSNKKASDSDQAITDIDVLFGDDAIEVRDKWEVRGVPLQIGSGGSLRSAHVTIRRGASRPHKKPKLHIPDTGRFKIMQLADLHLSTGVGACRDAVPDNYNGGKCEADPRTLDFVVKMIEEEKPHMVVLSGDQVNGETARDPQSAIFKIVAILKEHKIPWAAIFGNHDDAQGVSREAQMELMETLPYSLSESGPAEIEGVGNYYVEILGRGGSDHSAVTVYFLDTHAYSPDERHYPGYDWIKPNQIDWFKKTAESLKKPHSEYANRHLDISFVHIPLTEYTDYNNTWVGDWKEGVTAPVFNSGFRDALVEQGVVMVSAGQ